MSHSWPVSVSRTIDMATSTTTTVSEERRASATLLSLAGDALRLAAAAAALRLRGQSGAAGAAVVPLEEVAWHDRPDDCWVVVHDRVFDVTPLLATHPGGAEVLLELAGRDATGAFQGFGHPQAAASLLLDRHCVGVLPPHQRIYDDAGRLSLPLT